MLGTGPPLCFTSVGSFLNLLHDAFLQFGLSVCPWLLISRDRVIGDTATLRAGIAPSQRSVKLLRPESKVYWLPIGGNY